MDVPFKWIIERYSATFWAESLVGSAKQARGNDFYGGMVKRGGGGALTETHYPTMWALIYLDMQQFDSTIKATYHSIHSSASQAPGFDFCCVRLESFRNRSSESKSESEIQICFWLGSSANRAPGFDFSCFWLGSSANWASGTDFCCLQLGSFRNRGSESKTESEIQIIELENK